MVVTDYEEIAGRVRTLPPADRRRLARSILRELDKDRFSDSVSMAEELSRMAADPEIRAELRRIDEEFRQTELDGLE